MECPCTVYDGAPEWALLFSGHGLAEELQSTLHLPVPECQGQVPAYDYPLINDKKFIWAALAPAAPPSKKVFNFSSNCEGHAGLLVQGSCQHCF